jgi:hypothetical protein
MLLLHQGWFDQRTPRQPARDVGLWLLAWSATYPLMALMSRYVVTFILKDVLALLPFIALTGGVFLGHLLQRRIGRVVVAAIGAFVSWQGLELVFHSIVYAFTQLK